MSAIEEMPKIVNTQDGILALVSDHEKVARTFRDIVSIAVEVDDIVTASHLTRHMSVHETAGWMLRSSIAQ